jgi:hypothetical protein
MKWWICNIKNFFTRFKAWTQGVKLSQNTSILNKFNLILFLIYIKQPPMSIIFIIGWSEYIFIFIHLYI